MKTESDSSFVLCCVLRPDSSIVSADVFSGETGAALVAEIRTSAARAGFAVVEVALSLALLCPELVAAFRGLYATAAHSLGSHPDAMPAFRRAAAVLGLASDALPAAPAVDLRGLVAGLSDALRESHQAEIDGGHFGDGAEGCSYCALLARADALFVDAPAAPVDSSGPAFVPRVFDSDCDQCGPSCAVLRDGGWVCGSCGAPVVPEL